MGKHSEQTKAKALELLTNPEMSYPAVRDATGVPVGTLAGWAKKAGIERPQTKTEAATTARLTRLAAKRSKIAEEFLDAARTFVDKAKVIGQQTGGGREAKDLMTAAAIGLDKMRLELGEPTVHEHHTGDTGAAEAAKSKIDELSQRRNRKTVATRV